MSRYAGSTRSSDQYTVAQKAPDRGRQRAKSGADRGTGHKLLDAAKDRSNALNDAINAEVFEQGFRLGATLMLETVNGTTEE